MKFQIKDSFAIEETFEIGLINKVLSVQEFSDNLIRETEKFKKCKYCTIQQTKRLTNFSYICIDLF